MNPAFRAALSGIDWPRALLGAAALVRAIRGDSAADIAGDCARETQRGQKLHHVVESFARAALGCRAPNPCDCAVCEEKRS